MTRSTGSRTPPPSKYWAYKRGQEGLPIYDRPAIDVGSTVHGMAERSSCVEAAFGGVHSR
jgi:hypothetical protein